MLQNFVDGSNIQRSQLSSLIELLIASVTMILVAIAVYRLPLLLTAPISLMILGGIAYFSVYKYTSSLVLLDATFPVIAGFLVFNRRHLIIFTNNTNYVNKLRNSLSITLLQQWLKNYRRILNCYS